jgi:hypothetical protein
MHDLVAQPGGDVGELCVCGEAPLDLKIRRLHERRPYVSARDPSGLNGRATALDNEHTKCRRTPVGT